MITAFLPAPSRCIHKNQKYLKWVSQLLQGGQIWATMTSGRFAAILSQLKYDPGPTGRSFSAAQAEQS
ncbi:MAG: hypothetical protein WBN03_14775, partial [Desulfobacterales bacterium]